MSIASEITRLQNAKAAIRTALVGKGVAASSHNVSQFAADIDSIETGITPSGTRTITENGTYDVTGFASAQVNVTPEVLTGTFRHTGESYTHTIATGRQCHSLAIFQLDDTTTQQLAVLIATDATTAGGTEPIVYLRSRGTYVSPYTDNADVSFGPTEIVITMNSSGGNVYAPFGANVRYRYVAF